MHLYYRPWARARGLTLVVVMTAAAASVAAAQAPPPSLLAGSPCEGTAQSLPAPSTTPRLSLSAAPGTFGATLGPSGDIEVSQALPSWGTLSARKNVARAQAAAAGHHDPRGL